MLPAVLLLLALTPSLSFGQETKQAPADKASALSRGTRESAPTKTTSAPPIPLHQIEGAGGVGLTELAYLVNPSETGSPFGLPSFSATHVQAAHKAVEVLAISETLFGRIEISYGYNYVGLGDFHDAVQDHLGVDVSRNDVKLHNLNARALLVKEGAFDQPWVPAVTAGVHYKYNDGIKDVDRDLGGALYNALGVNDNDGVDYTLTATKLLKNGLPRPAFVSATARNTSAAQLGWLGFTDHRVTVFEGNAGIFARDKLILAAEYRQKPDQLKEVPGVLGNEDDWWTLAVAYIVNDRLTLSAAYANLGTMLNHEEPAALWLQAKYEF